MDHKRLIGLITCLLVIVAKGAYSYYLPEGTNNKFLNFAFASNMLAKRISIETPTAVRIGPARLQDYRLDFAHESSRWNGAVATIVPSKGAETWGTLWQIDQSDQLDIENQIGVNRGLYEPHTVYVRLQNETEVTAAITYLLTQQPESNLFELTRDLIPESRQPSKTYLQSIVRGAIESSLPEDYVQLLRRIKHNGRISEEMEKKLGLKDVVNLE
ncbi:hypothetical protein KR038_002275 [Drosophila bunnanda]|nr:hypothetical protein KR038_002275 [Drosophila bunnanda]